MPFFKHEGHRLAYTSFGSGPRTCVLIHGLLLSQKMHLPLAKDLAARGNRVVTLDLLGHGRADRPRDMSRYSMTTFGEAVVRGLFQVADTSPDLVMLERTVNGQPGLVLQQGGVTGTVMAFEIAGDRIVRIWAIRNPEKLRPWTDL